MNKFLTISAFTLVLSALFFLASAQDVVIEEKKEATFGIWATDPQFPGGETKLLKFINENLSYPKDALKNKIEGRVITTFVIEKDGTITDIKIIRGLSKSTDEEAIRIIKLFPKWKPGTQRDQPVRVQYAMPIKFSLDNKL